MRRIRTLFWVFFACLAALAVLGWLSYVGNGMAYGAVSGLPGRDKQLAMLRERAFTGLAIAVSAEGLLVAAITWACWTAATRLWIKLLVASTVALIVDAFTYVVAKSL